MDDKRIDELINKALQEDLALPEGLSERLERRIDFLAQEEVSPRVSRRRSFYWISVQPSQKRLNHNAFLTGTTKELSTMPKTFVYTAITVKKQMPVEKSCSAALNVHPVQPATKPVRISKRNGAADLIRRLMYVMAVQ